MTDLLLAAVVVGAVIAFGALLSIGNERQRRAIEALHQAHKQWAIHDLRLKRGAVSAHIQIKDPAIWLAKVTSLAFGRRINVMDYQVHNTPIVSVEFHDVETDATIVCGLESPEVLMKALKKKRPRPWGEVHTNPLYQLGKRTSAVELSLLNAGPVFDMELPIAWNMLTGQITECDTLWAFILS
jgi:hypothetical protein